MTQHTIAALVGDSKTTSPVGRRVVALCVFFALAGCNSSVTPTSSVAARSPDRSSCAVTIAAPPIAVPAAVTAFILGGVVLPPGMTPAPLDTMFGNDAMWVQLGTSDGTLVVGPDLHAKFVSYRLVDGNLTVSARRLDGPTGSVEISVPDGYGSSGFQAVGIVFPSPGCWSMTETVPGHDLVFVLRVLSAPTSYRRWVTD